MNNRLIPLATSVLLELFRAGNSEAATDIVGTSGTCAGSCTISPSAGVMSGTNLFHSFTRFSIGKGDTVTFATVPETRIDNVLTRVTGGTLSLIEGKIALEPGAGNRNFYLINPAGVTFAQGTAIDVPGAFYVGTADYIKFADGKFHADPGVESIFSSFAPEAFGFLGNNRGSVAITNGAELKTGNMPIAVIAGDITISGGQVRTESGSLQIIAVGNTPIEIRPLESALVNGDLTIIDGGQLYSEATGTDGGKMTVAAGNIYVNSLDNHEVETGILSYANSGSSGKAGDIDIVATGNIVLTNGGYVSSKTYSSGNAGTIILTGNNILIDGAGKSVIPDGENLEVITGATSYAKSGSGSAGAIRVTATEELSIIGGGIISTSTFSSGLGGMVTVQTDKLTIDGAGITPTGIGSSASSGSTADAGRIDINAREITLLQGGIISSKTAANGNGGTVIIKSDSIVVDGKGNNRTGITSDCTFGSSGNAGLIDVTATSLLMMNGGSISSNTFSTGKGGAINVMAESIRIDGTNIPSTKAGIFSLAHSSGDAGNLTIHSTGYLELINGGKISSSTFGAGNAGLITVRANDVLIDGQGALIQTGIFCDTNPRATGDAGVVDFDATGTLIIANYGAISSSTLSSGNAGQVSVKAGAISIDGTGSSLFTGIVSDAIAGSGNAGNVEVAAAGAIDLTNGGEISSSTWTVGNGGAVSVSANDIRISGLGINDFVGISARATETSSGLVGSLTISAKQDIVLANGGEISIENAATTNSGLTSEASSSLTIKAGGRIVLNDAAITAAAAGKSAASNIDIHAEQGIELVQSSISTRSNDGDGGAIRIISPRYISLDSSQITTSVTGLTGNGGDIDISSPNLILSTGFIQANTAATNARGGNIFLAVDAVLPSGGLLFLGGDQPRAFQPDVFGYNVIQAAAPDGVAGVIEITSPVADNSGNLISVNARILDGAVLTRNPCDIGNGSSFSLVGHGGLPLSARGPLRIDLPELDTADPHNHALAPIILRSGLGCQP